MLLCFLVLEQNETLLVINIGKIIVVLLPFFPLCSDNVYSCSINSAENINSKVQVPL